MCRAGSEGLIGKRGGARTNDFAENASCQRESRRNRDVGCLGGNWGGGSQLLKLGHMGEVMRGGWRNPRARLTGSRAAQYEQGGWRWMTLARSPHKAVKLPPCRFGGWATAVAGGEVKRAGCGSAASCMSTHRGHLTDAHAGPPLRDSGWQISARTPPVNSAGGDEEIETMTSTSGSGSSINSHRWRRWNSSAPPARTAQGHGSTISTGPETGPSWRQAVCWTRRYAPLPPQVRVAAYILRRLR